jgi:hypothetical protein
MASVVAGIELLVALRIRVYSEAPVEPLEAASRPPSQVAGRERSTTSHYRLMTNYRYLLN